jgi:DNA repair exonuclease SbcCD ATPase subunit/DNA repair exonuclease SbcCD nuclease subunit
MSLICLTSDSHFRGRDLENRIKVFSKMVQICESYEVDLIIHAGDLFDKGYVGDKKAPAEKIVQSVMRACSEHIPMILLSGNHDQYGEFGHGLDFIHHPMITKVDKVEHIHWTDDLSIFCIPWLRNDKDYSQRVYEKLENTKVYGAKTRIVVGHLNVIGCSIGEHGYVNAESYFSFGLPDLENSKYDPTHLFFGHIHNKMILSEKSRYLGAMTQLRFHEDEGKKAGFHLFDTDKGTVDFVDLSHLASEYYSIFEEDLDRYDLSKDYVRFYTDIPDKYRGNDHIIPLQRELETTDVSEVSKELRSNNINIGHLIKKYCEVKNLVEPESELYQREKQSLSINLSQKMTGLDFIHDIRVKGVSLYDKEKKVSFNPGFTVVCGPNGCGKTTLLESVYGSLYDKFPKRGNIKNYMEKESFIETNLTAQGIDYNIRKNLANKRFISFINGKPYELATQFKSAVEPIFGNSDLFGKLVFLDSSDKFDLVEPASGTRLQVLRELFDLDYFDDKQNEYKQELKNKLAQVTVLKNYSNEYELKRKELEELELPEDMPSRKDLNVRLNDARNELRRYKLVNEKYSKWVEANALLSQWLNFQKVHDVAKLAEAYKKHKELKQRLYTANNFKGVGCKDNPLPCVFLKSKVIENSDLLQKEIDELNSEFDFKNYEYYLALDSKYSNMDKEPVKRVPEEEMDSLRELISKLEVELGNQLVYDKLRLARQNIIDRLNELADHLKEDSLEEIEKDIYALRFLIELCSKSGLSLYIIDIIKVELQSIINELIGYGELPFRIELSTAKNSDLDSFEILFCKRRKKYEVKFASSGEIDLVKILFKFALMVYLNRYYGNYKVLIADEPTAHVDKSMTYAVLDIIKKLSKEFNQIILISHDDTIANAADYRVDL